MGLTNTLPTCQKRKKKLIKRLIFNSPHRQLQVNLDSLHTDNHSFLAKSI
jgi:hypothetical protein